MIANHEIFKNRFFNSDTKIVSFLAKRENEILYICTIRFGVVLNGRVDSTSVHQPALVVQVI